MKRCRGFTLVELLVVVAVIALLLAIMLPILGRSKESARRTICATNLRGQGQIILFYADQNNNRLPRFDKDTPGGATGGVWLTDQAVGFGNCMLSKEPGDTSVTSNMTDPNSIRRLFYCPSNPEQNADFMWDKWVPEHNYRAFGYNYLNKRGKGQEIPDPLVTIPPRNPPLVFQSTMIVPNPSNTELAFDVIISDPGNTVFAYPIANLNNNTTSHMEKGLPAGANVLAFDGHVAWRKFDKNNAVYISTPDSLKISQWIPNP